MFDEDSRTDGGEGFRSQSYQNAIKMLREAWEDVVGKPMHPLQGRGPRARFEHALELIRAHWKGSNVEDTPLFEKLPNETRVWLAGGYDIDDVSPKIFLNSIHAAAAEAFANGNEGADQLDVDLRYFLRNVYDLIEEAMEWGGQINVGDNRHFWRSMQWLREVQDDTTVDLDNGSVGFGLKLMNRNAGGPVARFPSGPDGLRVRLIRNWL